MNERLFQYIWSNLYFDFRRLVTITGEKITIIHQGVLNDGDGPDFLDSVIEVDGLIFHGSIELHLNAKDWYLHNHQEDERYDNVILHVVLFETDLCNVTRSDGTHPFTLILKPYISSKIHSVFKRQNQLQQLSCSGFLKETPEQVIRKQWEKSQSDYFEYKTDQLIPFFEVSENPWKAWKIAMAYGLFDGLGINDNREPMKRLCSLILQQKNWESLPVKDLSHYLWQLSGLSTNSEKAQMSKKEWSFSGTRPKNQPDARIPQAALLLYNLKQIPMPRSISDIGKVWKQLIHPQEEISTPIGKGRRDILYATVYLPSLYLIGSRISDNKLKEAAFNLWKGYRIRIPQKISKFFSATGLDSKYYKNNLGVVFHYKHYCNAGRCQQCKIMKYALKT